MKLGTLRTVKLLNDSQCTTRRRNGRRKQIQIAIRFCSRCLIRLAAQKSKVMKASQKSTIRKETQRIRTPRTYMYQELSSSRWLKAYSRLRWTTWFTDWRIFWRSITLARTRVIRSACRWCWSWISSTQVFLSSPLIFLVNPMNQVTQTVLLRCIRCGSALASRRGQQVLPWRNRLLLLSQIVMRTKKCCHLTPRCRSFTLRVRSRR